MSLVGHLDHRGTPLDCFMANWKTIRLTFYGFFAEYSFERADVTKDFYLQLADTLWGFKFSLFINHNILQNHLICARLFKVNWDMYLC